MTKFFLTYGAENIELETKNASAKCHRMHFIFTSVLELEYWDIFVELFLQLDLICNQLFIPKKVITSDFLQKVLEYLRKIVYAATYLYNITSDTQIPWTNKLIDNKGGPVQKSYHHTIDWRNNDNINI